MSPLLIWAIAVYGSPFLRTYRHRLSGGLSLFAGALMFASFRLDDPTFPILLAAAGTALLIMFVALLWPIRHTRTTRKVR